MEQKLLLSHERAASPQLSLHLPECHRDVKRGRQARGPLTQKVGAKLEARGPQGEDATGAWPQGCAAPAAEAGSRTPNISGPGGCQDGHRAVDHRALTEQRGGVSAQEADRTGGGGWQQEAGEATRQVGETRASGATQSNGLY